jgi:hypothetical protein
MEHTKGIYRFMRLRSIEFGDFTTKTDVDSLFRIQAIIAQVHSFVSW